MSGFWSSETMRTRISSEGIVHPYDPTQIVNCSYELRLGAEAYVTGDNIRTKRELREGEQLRIPPGQFANLLTEETLKVPPDALGLISAKFRWKKRGLVNVSGFHVDPGYEGKILFSVYNAGPETVVIGRGDRLFLVWFAGLDQVTGDVYRKEVREHISSGDVNELQGDSASPQELAIRVQALERLATGVKFVAAAAFTAAIAIGLQALANSLQDKRESPPAPPATSTPFVAP